MMMMMMLMVHCNFVLDPRFKVPLLAIWKAFSESKFPTLLDDYSNQKQLCKSGVGKLVQWGFSACSWSAALLQRRRREMHNLQFSRRKKHFWVMMKFLCPLRSFHSLRVLIFSHYFWLRGTMTTKNAMYSGKKVWINYAYFVIAQGLNICAICREIIRAP